MWPEASHTLEARTQWRQEQAQPLLDSMHDWLRQTRMMVANGGGLAKAIDLIFLNVILILLLMRE